MWHAYRGALAFAEAVELPPRESKDNPCDTCVDRPCLNTCPVAAFAPGSYDVPACTAYLDATADNDCLGQGCRARRACPVGREHIYGPDQANLHMSAFLRANRK